MASALYLDRPFFGSRRMAVTLGVGRTRMRQLMRILGIKAHYSKRNLSRPVPGHEIYPYLLRGVLLPRSDRSKIFRVDVYDGALKGLCSNPIKYIITDVGDGKLDCPVGSSASEIRNLSFDRIRPTVQSFALTRGQDGTRLSLSIVVFGTGPLDYR